MANPVPLINTALFLGHGFSICGAKLYQLFHLTEAIAIGANPHLLLGTLPTLVLSRPSKNMGGGYLSKSVMPL